jgi:quercetin dioxygenase-like cupin family protein
MTQDAVFRGAQIIETESLRPAAGGAPEGYEHGSSSVSCYVVATPPGLGPSLHCRPYHEVFVLLEGEARVWVDGEPIEVHGGQEETP